MRGLFKFWLDRIGDAFERARGRVELGLFVLLLLSRPISERFGTFQLDRATWWFAVGAFVAIFLFEACFVSPYRHAQKQQGEHDAQLAKVHLERDQLSRQLEWIQDQARKDELRRDKDRDENRRRVMLCIIEQTKIEYEPPLRALQFCDAEELENNDELLMVCGEIQEHGHPCPFAEIKDHVRRELWLDFLREARLRAVDLGNSSDLERYLIERPFDKAAS